MTPSEFQPGHYYCFKHLKNNNIVIWQCLGDTCKLIKSGNGDNPGEIIQTISILYPRKEYPEEYRWHELTDEMAARLL